MAKKVNSPKSGNRRNFVCLQIDIVGHGKLRAPDRDQHEAKRLFHGATEQIVEHHGGRSFKWEGDGGAFLFPVTDDSEFDKACQAALEIFDSLPDVNQKIISSTALGHPLRIRVSLDYGEAIDDQKPGLIHGEFLNKFLKHERAIAHQDTVTMTERVFKQLAPSMKVRFVQASYSKEVESQLYRSGKLADQEQIKSWLDSTSKAFIHHLVSYDSIWIVGITNEHLVEHLRHAFTLRNERAWKEIRVLFQARHLVKEFREGGAERVPAWDKGVKGTIDFFLQGSVEKAKNLDIRHVNRILPFVGQFYDYSHVRVAFVLPVPDIQTSCYLNCRVTEANLGLHPPFAEDPSEEVKQYQAIRGAFEHLRNVSTPLLTANVIGRRAPDGAFQFESLLPQNNWRHSADLRIGRMAHLVTFILLYDDKHVYLQMRDENNSNGQLLKLGVLPGKVNDEDFFTIEALPHRAYRNHIYEMQKSFDELHKNAADDTAANQRRQRATDDFSSITQIQTKSAIPATRLLEVCRRAGVRYLDEKLGLSVSEGRLHSVHNRHYFVEKPDYSLYAHLYELRLTSEEISQIQVRRPFANLVQMDLKAFERERTDGKLSLFLERNFDEIFLFLNAKLG